MPADEPDETTGTARGGGEGRHRPGHRRAAARTTARTPASELPPAGRGDDRPRHARGAAATAHDPWNDERYDADPYGDWYAGGDPFRAAAPLPADQPAADQPAADQPAAEHGTGAAADDAEPTTGSWPYEPGEAGPAGTGRDPRAAAPYGSDPYHLDPEADGQYGYGQYGNGRYAAAERTRGQDTGGADPYAGSWYEAAPAAAQRYADDRRAPGSATPFLDPRTDPYVDPRDARDPHPADADPSGAPQAGRAAPYPGPPSGSTPRPSDGGNAHRDAGHRDTRHRAADLAVSRSDGTDPQDAPYRGAAQPVRQAPTPPYPGDGRDPDRDGPYGADPYGADPYAADPYGSELYGADPYDAPSDPGRPGTGPEAGAAPAPAEPGRATAADPAAHDLAPDPRSPGRAAGPDPAHGRYGSGSATAGDTPSRPDPAAHPRDRPLADDAAVFGAAPEDGVAGSTGGRDVRARPGRRTPDPGPPTPPGLPSRRPGDPPGVPAELFVETTAETPALRFDDEPEDPPEADPAPGRRAWTERLLRRRPAAEPVAAAGHGHGHGHGHGPARPAGRRVRVLIAALLVPCALATLVGVVLLWPTGGPPSTAQASAQTPVQAQVTATQPTDCTPGSGDRGCVALVVHMADGPLPGRDLVQVVPVEPGTPRFAVGDEVVLGWSGADPQDAGSYQVVDFQRGAPLAWLAGLFALAVLLLGRWRGLAALAALVLSFGVLLLFVLPSILAGHDPLAVAVVGSCLIMFAVLYLTHGPSARTSTAVLGTLLSLALIGVLGAAFSAAAQLTGLDDQTSNLIASLGTGVDARGLLLAGMVIGALGVLDDVTVTQTSAVWELRAANPQLGARGLFTAAMRIGRDHVASAVNTLVLAYAGAALPLLLLFSLSGQGFGPVVTAQDVATEVVRTLVGSIGLVASVPITTALAAAVAVREKAPEAEPAAA